MGKTQNEVGRVRAQTLCARKEEMKLANIPRSLQLKVEATYEHVWRYGDIKDGMLRDKTLSLDLRRELAACLYGEALRRVPIFADMAQTSLKALAQKVETRLYTPGDLVMTLGEVGTELFVIMTGSAIPLGPDGEQVMDNVLGPGAFFGEVCFLNPGSKRSSSIRALEFCQTMVLTLDAFQELNLQEVIWAMWEDLAGASSDVLRPKSREVSTTSEPAVVNDESYDI